ncbi:MAG: class I SAM-dependent methyltransferase [Candidatus Sumerlaeia bacterium]|nr:class I SAM-dependent methyltransferase [Candidatus Sumerlaeia bacterium]
MNDPASHFDNIYRNAGGDAVFVPWADLAPNPHLLEWLGRADAPAAGIRALVVGCGLGDDAEELARRGYAVTAFDIAPTAVEWARGRFPGSPVAYRVADLLAPPAEWAGAFDLVLESYTVQALPRAMRARAVAGVRGLVAPGGRAVVIARRFLEGMNAESGPPWPLTEAELALFAEPPLRVLSVGRVADHTGERTARWRAEFIRE